LALAPLSQLSIPKKQVTIYKFIHIQELLRLKAIEKELTEQNGHDPSFAMWAAAADIDQRTLKRRLEHGIRCKDKMIRCNIRLVVSIAKNYVGSGLAFEDLILVCVIQTSFFFCLYQLFVYLSMTIVLQICMSVHGRS
jgi:DNA-directed RNA polymerase sigma subunit (sigma70/sigma32)